MRRIFSVLFIQGIINFIIITGLFGLFNLNKTWMTALLLIMVNACCSVYVMDYEDKKWKGERK